MNASRLDRYSDFLTAGIVVLIIVMILVPLSPFILDLLIAFNFALSLLVMLVTMYTQEPLHFSVFPTLLLLATVFRLAINIAVTRQILVNANAGSMVRAFGNFVISGNLIVGLVVFFIIVIVQFVVITSGANRVAEVAARFTLDAMPGKQMSIDADLNAGLISEEEARRRREEVAREADFYGAMDGASKFVKGDAIAAIVVVFVNLLGGLAVGAFQKGMDLNAAVNTYSLLTIGAGLVVQVPALLVSTATGVIITRAAAEANLGSDLSRQLLRQPRALQIGAGIIGLLALLPGLPKVSLLAMALGTFGVSLAMRREVKEAVPEAEVEEEPLGPRSREEVLELVKVDPMELELGYDLIPLVDPGSGSDFMDRVILVRRQIALELGIVVPPIRLRDNLTLSPDTYRILIRGAEVARGELRTRGYLALNAGEADTTFPGVPTTEPAFGLPALWIGEDMAETAKSAGYTVVDPASVLLTHLTETIRRHAAELLSRQDTQALLDLVKRDNPVVVEELVPGQLTVGEVHRVLQRLLEEGVPVRDLVTILEVLGDRSRFTRDVDQLAESVRRALSRTITRKYLSEDGVLYVVTLDPALERTVEESVQQVGGEPVLAMDPALAERFISRLAGVVGDAAGTGNQPVLLCGTGARRFLRRMLARIMPHLAVISYEEVAPGVEIKSLGTVDIGEPETMGAPGGKTGN
ncbi:MAG: flagellar biosynthesis protein FlhA [Actinomycetota bacterium]|nr:flagellar biosynthesis protein FlhA [Actinomycetota bacterium]MDI7251167.1 flagellar biosynthesis protein FlhA [Actinomycetota bacterium]